MIVARATCVDCILLCAPTSDDTYTRYCFPPLYHYTIPPYRPLPPSSPTHQETKYPPLERKGT